MKKLLVILLITLPALLLSQKTLTPDLIYGDLFKEIQLQRIFPDGKTFVDCVPKRKVADIMYDYGLAKGPGFDLKKFVADNFELPLTPAANYNSDTKQDLSAHIKTFGRF